MTRHSGIKNLVPLVSKIHFSFPVRLSAARHFGASYPTPEAWFLILELLRSLPTADASDTPNLRFSLPDFVRASHRHFLFVHFSPRKRVTFVNVSRLKIT